MQWLFEQGSIDWIELSKLYRIAPLMRMRTAMAIFQNQDRAITGGLVDDT